MEIFFLRHVNAHDLGPSYKTDRERPLTKVGKHKIKQIAKGMKKLKLTFDLILCSPLVRAEETAQGLKMKKKIILTKNLAPDADFKKLISEIKKYTRSKRVLLVGHEPFLSQLISLLISGTTNCPITLKKGGLCTLSMKSLLYKKCATLEWLLTPKQCQ